MGDVVSLRGVFWAWCSLSAASLGPLILWQIKKDMDPLIDDQGKEALNFQITVAIAWLVCMVLGFVVIGFLLMLILVVAALVLTIIGGIKANNGTAYRYPWTWR